MNLNLLIYQFQIVICPIFVNDGNESLPSKEILSFWSKNIPTPHWCLINISGNGLMPSGSKPLFEPMLTYLSILPHGVIRPKQVQAICSIIVFNCLPKIHSETCFWVFCTLLQNMWTILPNDYSWLKLQIRQSTLINVWWILMCNACLRTQSNLCVIIIIRKCDKCMQRKLLEEIIRDFEN